MIAAIIEDSEKKAHAIENRHEQQADWYRSGMMIKRMVIMLVAVAVVFGGVFGFQIFKAAMIKKFITAMSNQPQTISAATAATSEWQPKIEAIGSVRAVRGPTCRSRCRAWSS